MALLLLLAPLAQAETINIASNPLQMDLFSNMRSTFDQAQKQKQQLGSLFSTDGFFSGLGSGKTTTSGSNVISGSGNQLQGYNNRVGGESNSLIGANTTILGDFNQAFGLGNTIFGSSNAMKGNNNQVKGS
jgi:hypothetical protein